MDYATVLWDTFPSISSPNVAIETINLEGMSSLIRLAMFPYAPPGTKIKLEPYAINLEQPYKIGSINTKAVTRYWNGEGRKDFAVIKEIAGIVLKLMPPVLIKSNKPIDPITKIYLFAIDGLKFIKSTFFAEEPHTNKIPDSNTFCAKFDPKKHPIITDKLAAQCVMKTTNLFQYYCFSKQKDPENFTEMQSTLKEGYSDLLLTQISNGLLLLKESQGSSPIATEWLCKKEFYSLDMLVQGRIIYYEKLLTNSSFLLSVQGKKKHSQQLQNIKEQ
ncbi:MAG TPA: hypothetical protein PLC42_05485 [Parachlamydiaceae bacterium]|nr:hypothetical protein [Parachlamydiaceae bacterium]